MRAAHAQHITFGLPAQHHLDLANPVHAVGRHPGERHIRSDGSLDHPSRELGLGREGDLPRHMRRGPACCVIRPSFWQIERPIDEGMALAGDVGGKDPNLAVRDLAR